jgi:hypothetical protein
MASTARRKASARNRKPPLAGDRFVNYDQG